MNYSDTDAIIECIDKMLALTIYFYISKKSLGLYSDSKNGEHNVEDFVKSRVDVDVITRLKLVDITNKYSNVSRFLQDLFIGNYSKSNISDVYSLTSREETYFCEAISIDFGVSNFSDLFLAISCNVDLARKLFDFCQSNVMKLISELYVILLNSDQMPNVEYLKHKIFYSFDKSLRPQLLTSISYSDITSELCHAISNFKVG